MTVMICTTSSVGDGWSHLSWTVDRPLTVWSSHLAYESWCRPLTFFLVCRFYHCLTIHILCHIMAVLSMLMITGTISLTVSQWSETVSAQLTASNQKPDLSVSLCFNITIWPWQLRRWWSMIVTWNASSVFVWRDVSHVVFHVSKEKYKAFQR